MFGRLFFRWVKNEHLFVSYFNDFYSIYISFMTCLTINLNDSCWIFCVILTAAFWHSSVLVDSGADQGRSVFIRLGLFLFLGLLFASFFSPYFLLVFLFLTCCWFWTGRRLVSACSDGTLADFV